MTEISNCLDRVAFVETYGKEGFTLIVKHWDQRRKTYLLKIDLRYKVCASLLDLPLMCWNVDAVATIISSFGMPFWANRSSLRWDNITSFDIQFYCKDLADIPEIIQVTIGPHTYAVRLIVKFSRLEIPPFEDSASNKEDPDDLGDNECNFWFGSPSKN
ncbi:hypothetical protein COCNU_05G005450 [Cocos nucifera]|uniref:DUF4283 domain-containing protein n=1 Tax=Cocos nucifera TaxID=13894 RepID=A0A8K0I8Z5_COCNU|nr:hypothetical protein COCNU_05G005450 [Cocos nucifera]